MNTGLDTKNVNIRHYTDKTVDCFVCIMLCSVISTHNRIKNGNWSVCVSVCVYTLERGILRNCYSLKDDDDDGGDGDPKNQTKRSNNENKTGGKSHVTEKNKCMLAPPFARLPVDALKRAHK